MCIRDRCISSVKCRRASAVPLSQVQVWIQTDRNPVSVSFLVAKPVCYLWQQFTETGEKWNGWYELIFFFSLFGLSSGTIIAAFHSPGNLLEIQISLTRVHSSAGSLSNFITYRCGWNLLLKLCFSIAWWLLLFNSSVLVGHIHLDGKTGEKGCTKSTDLYLSLIHI